MSKLDNLERDLNALAIEIETTSRERDDARDAYYRAADRHDNEGMRKYGTLWNTYEALLINLRENRTDVSENLRKEKKDTALKRGDNDD